MATCGDIEVELEEAGDNLVRCPNCGAILNEETLEVVEPPTT